MITLEINKLSFQNKLNPEHKDKAYDRKDYICGAITVRLRSFFIYFSSFSFIIYCVDTNVGELGVHLGIRKLRKRIDSFSASEFPQV